MPGPVGLQKKKSKAFSAYFFGFGHPYLLWAEFGLSLVGKLI
jgi:hypothetical protein